MAHGAMLMLNGTSSAGKTSIRTALQSLLDGPYLLAGMDTFFRMLPGRYLWGPEWTQVLGAGTHPGPIGQTLVSGMHHAWAALLQRGNHRLVDHVLLEPDWIVECAALFAGLPAYLIGVYCPLLVAEQREQQRPDRAPGQARAHFDRVHQHGVYDLVVDTSITDASGCAHAIKHFLDANVPPSAFRRLKQEIGR
jgi:chloramphenicol 3-O phosphotransferase